MILTEFLDRIEKLKSLAPTYRNGGSGKDGTCDCIGMVMYALNDEYPMHSTNYFARYEMEAKSLITSKEQCFLGMVVYKMRGVNEAGYDLNARYLLNGRYYTKDIFDYYHVGVVTNMEPFTVTHCTSTNNVNGITQDFELDGWDCCGYLNDVEYDDQLAVDPASDVVVYRGRVESANGKGVILRKEPDLTGRYICTIPEYSTIKILENTTDSYCKVHYVNEVLRKNVIGYCDRRYIIPLDAVTMSTDIISKLKKWIAEGEAIINSLDGSI